MFSEEEIMEGLKKSLEVCKNEKEKKITKRVITMSLDTRLWWQDLGKQIPFLLFVFIGSTIFKDHWVLKAAIIIYVVYGYKVQYDEWYYYEYIYPRLGEKFRKEKGIK